MSCQVITPHSFSSLSENEKRDAESDNGKSSEPRGPWSPWGHQSGSRSGSGGGQCAGSACGRSRWSCGAWPSHPSCLFEEKKFVSRVVSTIACILISSPRTMPFFPYPYSYHQVLEGVMRTLAGLSGRVATVSTGGLLDVEGPLA